MPQYSEGVRYIKIAKRDKNGVDQTNTLQSLTEITIPFSTSNITYNIISITEKPTYFLYSVPYTGVEWADRAEINYDFTGSTLLTSDTFQGVNDMTGAPELFKKIPIISSTKDNLGFLHTGSSTNTNNLNPLNTYRFLTYPQETLLIEFSGSIMLTPGGSGTAFGNVGVGLAYIKENSTVPEFGWRTSQGNSAATAVFTPHTTNPVTASFHISASISASVFNPLDAIYPTYETYVSLGYTKVTASFTSDTTFKISSPAASGPNLETVPEPYFGTNNFQIQGIDCQPLFNNANINRRHNLFMDVDYSAGVTEPTNFDLIISGSALKAEVQMSNYSTRRHILPRYIGSRNTTDDFNTSSISQSLYINTTQNIHLGDPSPNLTKFASVDNLDTTIFEFQYGGGTYPEIANGGALLINNVLNVGSKDAVDIFSPLDDYFDTMITRKFRPNDSPFIFQYETSAQTTAGARVIATNLGIPQKSSFMITSSGANRAAPQSSGNQLDINAFITTVSTNTSGYYIAGSPSQEDVRNLIKQGINAGEDWYVTIYENLPDTVQGQIQPFNSGSHANYTTPDSNGNYPYPLAKNGVYEITGVTALGLLEISPTFPQISGWNIGNDDKGALFWKSTKGKDITFEDATLSGVGKGAVVSEISSKTIKENITYITKTYGSNPTN